LLIVGGESDDPDPAVTPELGRLLAIAGEEGVSEHVTFVGRRGRETLKYYYSAADIFVTTPWYEPFGITPVEAMACGTPVVGSNVGGIKFTVRDSETGYLIAPNDPDALAERLAHLYAHPKLMALFSQQAVRRVNDLFTWRRVAEGLSALYGDVLSVIRPARHAEPDHGIVVDQAFDGIIAVLDDTRRRMRAHLVEAAGLIARCLTAGGKVLTCGHGYSGAAAEHLAGVLVGGSRGPHRQGRQALALNAGSALLGTLAHEVGPDYAFARQIEALALADDVFIAISADGCSVGLRHAFEAAQRRGLRSIALLGEPSADLRRYVDVALTVPSSSRAVVEQTHTVMIGILAQLIDERCAQAAEAPQAAGRPAPIWEWPRRTRQPPRRIRAAVGRRAGK
jgi:phosphoheptose isomerase